MARISFPYCPDTTAKESTTKKEQQKKCSGAPCLTDFVRRGDFARSAIQFATPRKHPKSGQIGNLPMLSFRDAAVPTAKRNHESGLA